jgi:hypothetical protein
MGTNYNLEGEVVGVRLPCRTLGLATSILLFVGSLQPQEPRRWLIHIWRISVMINQQFLSRGAPRVFHAADTAWARGINFLIEEWL